MKPDQRITELDKKLQEMASTNWPQFVALIGEDAIIAAKICMLRQRDKSYGEISVQLGITEKKARYWCGECDTNISTQRNPQ